MSEWIYTRDRLPPWFKFVDVAVLGDRTQSPRPMRLERAKLEAIREDGPSFVTHDIAYGVDDVCGDVYAWREDNLPEPPSE